jgi:predicted nicotinamide N-methyase
MPEVPSGSSEDILEQIGPLVRERIALPWSGSTVDIARPGNIDHLLDLAARDPEQNLPYWAEVWPSGIALADVIARDAPAWRGVRVLEVGCGLGTTAFAALRAGAELTVTDYAPGALALCRENARLNAVPEPAAVQLNWRNPDPRTMAALAGPFPVVLAADVLYEQRDMDPLLAFADQVVSPGGLIWLAEPGRAVALAWLDAARRRGWHIESEEHPGPWPDPKDAGVVVGLHRLRRTGAITL